MTQSRILTDEAQAVDEQGNVFMHGQRTTPLRAVWWSG